MPKGYHPMCNHCKGTGKVDYQGKKWECPVCQGHGKLMGTTVHEEEKK